MATGLLQHPLTARAQTAAPPPTGGTDTPGQAPIPARSVAPVPAQTSPSTPAQSTAPAPTAPPTPSQAPTQSQSPAPSSPPATQQRPAAPAPVKTFPVLEYRVEGNTLLKTIEIERAVMPYLGENKSIKDIDGARGQLERAYRDHGFKTVLVNIPQQQVTSGIVRLQVVEAPVGKLKIAGSRYHSLTVIRDKMAELNQGNVPNFDEVQKELGQVNRSPDLRVTPVLKASETPGKVDVDLDVKDELPLHAIVEVNNRYSANTSHPRVTGELRYDNLFQSDQSISLQYQIAPVQPSDAKVWSLSYVIPTASGLTWALYAVHSDSNVAAVGNLDVIGKGDIFGIRIIEPLPGGTRDFYHSFTAGVDYKDFKQSVLVEGSTDAIQSPVHYPPFTLQYSATWLGDFLKEGVTPAATANSRSNTSFDLGLSFIIRGLGTDWNQFANKRANAGTSYIILHPTLAREQILPGQWSVVGKVDGQLASGPLINNEQFSGGGADTVRGYTEAERLGDNALLGTLELRTPELLAKPFPRIEQSYVFLFTDAAKLQTLQPLPGQDKVFTLASAGLGLRFKTRGLSVALDGARILHDGYVTRSGRYRGLFKLSYAY